MEATEWIIQYLAEQAAATHSGFFVLLILLPEWNLKEWNYPLIPKRFKNSTDVQVQTHTDVVDKMISLHADNLELFLLSKFGADKLIYRILTCLFCTSEFLFFFIIGIHK